MSGAAEEALRQIEDKGYAIPYDAGERKVVKIGVEFDKAERNIGRWLVKEDGGA
ncbi:MAG: PD-(D/E)XK nuclease domain-containing protein [Oscillospiraceae bacterium]|nr:PD-(D/E)XK nuclease domain-containing protein [Oscillospiraceae bacterium]